MIVDIQIRCTQYAVAAAVYVQRRQQHICTKQQQRQRIHTAVGRFHMHASAHTHIRSQWSIEANEANETNG